MAVTTSDRSIGVDIEEVTLEISRLSIATQFFSATEQVELKELPDAQQIDRFFELWTAKESYVKALGVGLSMPLDAFSVSVRRDNDAALPLQAQLTSTPSCDDPKLWSIMLRDFPPCHKLALCARISGHQGSLSLKYLDFKHCLNL